MKKRNTVLILFNKTQLKSIKIIMMDDFVESSFTFIPNNCFVMEFLLEMETPHKTQLLR